MPDGSHEEFVRCDRAAEAGLVRLCVRWKWWPGWVGRPPFWCTRSS